MSLPLLGFFVWQLWHYQKQNLGLASLAAASMRLPPLGRAQRRCIRTSTLGGALALVARPSVLQIVSWRPPPALAADLHRAAWVVLGASAAVAIVGVWHTYRRRPRSSSPAAAAVYLLAVTFPMPLVIANSPYAALGGLTLAHGVQYLLLVGLVLVGSPGVPKRTDVARLLLIAAAVVALAGLLAAGSHLHADGGRVARALFGAYLGMVMTHFVVDAGLWRLRDEFPRRWLGERLPQLLG
jgi:hypothetical protein